MKQYSQKYPRFNRNYLHCPVCGNDINKGNVDNKYYQCMYCDTVWDTKSKLMFCEDIILTENMLIHGAKNKEIDDIALFDFSVPFCAIEKASNVVYKNDNCIKILKQRFIK